MHCLADWRKGRRERKPIILLRALSSQSKTLLLQKRTVFSGKIHPIRTCVYWVCKIINQQLHACVFKQLSLSKCLTNGQNTENFHIIYSVGCKVRTKNNKHFHSNEAVHIVYPGSVKLSRKIPAVLWTFSIS